VGLVKLNGNDLEIRGSSGAMEFYNGSVHGNSSALRMSISSGGIVGIGSTGIYAGTAAILNLQGSGIALKNDKNGSNNNWSYIQNTGTGSNSDINFYTGNNASALNLSHSGAATFSGSVGIGASIYVGGSKGTSMSSIYSASNYIYYNQSSASAIQAAGTNTVTNGSIVFTNTGGTGAYSIIGNVGPASGYGLYIQSQDRTAASYYPLLLQPNGGNVGIGTTSPSARLQVQGAINTSSGAAVVEVYTNLSSGTDPQMASNAGGANIHMDVNNFGSSSSGNGIIWKTKYGGNGGYTKTSAEIKFQPEGNYFRGGLGFYTNGTANATTNAVERMRISSGGNVGIPTSTASLVIGAPISSTVLYATQSVTGVAICGEGNYSNCGAHYESATDATTGWSPFYVNKYNWTSSQDDRWMAFSVNGYATDSATLSYSGGNFSIVNASDYRIKENIVAYTGGLAKINAISVKSFNKIDGVSRNITQEGFIAHELKEVIPLAVIGEKDAMKVNESGDTVPHYQTVSREALIPYLVSAIQEQQTIIEDLKSRIETLEG